MTGRVDGKVAFITGAARGQGRSHAVRLAEEGADIIAVDICKSVETVTYEGATPGDLAQTAELVEKAGGRIVAVEADVRDFAALSDAVDRGISRFGRLDIVCANAGILTMGAAHEQSEEQWQTILDVNLTGAWHAAKATIPQLISQDTGGSIIFVSSLMGLKGGPFASGYAATKFGVVGLAKSLAAELAQHRVRVNVLHPTNVLTTMLDNEMLRGMFRPDLEHPTLEDAKPAFAFLNMWSEPWVDPADVSNAVLYLASEEGRYVTGISLPIDLGASSK